MNAVVWEMLTASRFYQDNPMKSSGATKSQPVWTRFISYTAGLRRQKPSNFKDKSPRKSSLQHQKENLKAFKSFYFQPEHPNKRALHTIPAPKAKKKLLSVFSRKSAITLLPILSFLL